MGWLRRTVLVSMNTCNYMWLRYATANLGSNSICRYAALLVVSLVCYLATFVFSGLLFHWFTPSGHDCGLNTFFIVMTLIFVFVFAVVVLHPAVSFASHFSCFSHLQTQWNQINLCFAGRWKHSTSISYIFLLHVPLLQWSCKWTQRLRMQWTPQTLQSCFDRHYDHWVTHNCSLCCVFRCSCWFFHHPSLPSWFSPCRYISTMILFPFIALALV